MDSKKDKKTNTSLHASESSVILKLWLPSQTERGPHYGAMIKVCNQCADVLSTITGEEPEVLAKVLGRLGPTEPS